MQDARGCHCKHDRVVARLSQLVITKQAHQQNVGFRESEGGHSAEWTGVTCLSVLSDLYAISTVFCKVKHLQGVRYSLGRNFS